MTRDFRTLFKLREILKLSMIAFIDKVRTTSTSTDTDSVTLPPLTIPFHINEEKEEKEEKEEIINITPYSVFFCSKINGN